MPHDVDATRANLASQRRTFLGRLAAATAALGLTPWTSHAAAAPAIPDDLVQATEPWVRRLSGAQRVIFHSHEPTGGLALRWAQTFLDTQKNNYGRVDGDSSVVVGLNGKSVGLLFNDAMWAKYPIPGARRVATWLPNCSPAASSFSRVRIPFVRRDNDFFRSPRVLTPMHGRHSVSR